MAGKKKTGEKPQNFPISLNEFAAGIAKPETRGGFIFCMKDSKLDRQKVSAGEWEKLLELYRKKPVGVSFIEWAATSKK